MGITQVRKNFNEASYRRQLHDYLTMVSTGQRHSQLSKSCFLSALNEIVYSVEWNRWFIIFPQFSLLVTYTDVSSSWIFVIVTTWIHKHLCLSKYFVCGADVKYLYVFVITQEKVHLLDAGEKTPMLYERIRNSLATIRYNTFIFMKNSTMKMTGQFFGIST